MSNAENQAGGQVVPAGKKRQEIIQPDGEFPLLDQPQAMRGMMELITENLGGRKFNVLNLPKIRALKESGMFQVETAEETKNERILFGVITATRQARIYWGRAYNPGASKAPPACTSQDGFTGVGDPGGSCPACPFAQFRSARNPDGSQAQGQACKEMRQLLVLLPGQMLPHRLDVAPTSLQNFDKYTMNLIYANAAYWGVITKLGLEIVHSGGYPVARVTFSMSKRLTDDQKRLFLPYHEQMRDYLTPMTVEADPYESEGSDRNPDNVPF